MSNIIDKIQVSGVTYDIGGTGGGGNPTVELTQAEYDALVTAGTVSADTYYIITDAQAGDLTQYWTSAQTQSAINQATSGKADSSDVITNIVQDWYGGTQQLYIKYKKGGNDMSTPFIANGSGTTLTKSGGIVHVNVDNTTIQEKLVSGTNIKTINNESLLGSGNITIQGGGGGGKAIEAGRGISITTGETADTVSFNLPISANTDNSIVMGGKIVNSFTNNGKDCLMVGSKLTTNNGSDCCLVVGYRSSVNGDGSAAIGWYCESVGDSSFAFGTNVSARTSNSFATGYYTITNNNYEHTSGKYNVSNTGSTDADKTLFSVGNGTSNNARHNAFEIRQNGDIYLSSGGTDIKLQDHLGGGGGSITIDPSLDSGSTNPVANSAITQNFYNYAKFIGNASNGYGINVSFNEGTGNYMGINFYKLKTTANGESQTSSTSWCRISTINGKKAFSTDAANVSDFSLVETSAITTSVTSASTDSQIPSAKAVYDQFGGLKLVKLSQSEYDALATKDSNTLYVIVN